MDHYYLGKHRSLSRAHLPHEQHRVSQRLRARLALQQQHDDDDDDEQNHGGGHPDKWNLRNNMKQHAPQAVTRRTQGSARGAPRFSCKQPAARST
jgi:hypothetical protein